LARALPVARPRTSAMLADISVSFCEDIIMGLLINFSDFLVPTCRQTPIPK
jgi:hypothetical protein